MIELTAVTPQTVAQGQNILFTNTALKSGCAEMHRDGSGQITITKPGIYLVTFNADIAILTGGTLEAITAALKLDGEVLAGSTMTVTPSAAGDYFNVSTSHLIRVYSNCCGTCCVNVSAGNTSTEAITVQNANITVERKA